MEKVNTRISQKVKLLYSFNWECHILGCKSCIRLVNLRKHGGQLIPLLNKLCLYLETGVKKHTKDTSVLYSTYSPDEIPVWSHSTILWQISAALITPLYIFLRQQGRSPGHDIPSGPLSHHNPPRGRCVDQPVKKSLEQQQGNDRVPSSNHRLNTASWVHCCWKLNLVSCCGLWAFLSLKLDLITQWH